MARWVPDEQTAFARLRRETTAAEAMVWRALRGSRLAGSKFRRQVPVGPCVADFLCRKARLIVELDGAPHHDPTSSGHLLPRGEKERPLPPPPPRVTLARRSR